MPEILVEETRHVLSRCTFGPTRALVAEVEATGLEAWLERQLAPDEAPGSDLPPENEAILGLSARELRALYEARSDVPRRELRVATFRRAVGSPWQLRERLVELWSDHFHVQMADLLSSFLKPVDDREVVRAHALGRFEELLLASAHSPAMLYYLDQHRSVRGNPNENYARELFELHTLGAGNFTEDDVRAAAKLLTGWGFSNETLEFEFVPNRHDPEPVTILGRTYGSGGATGYEDGVSLLRDLAHHPATARFLAQKLCARFVSEEPSEALVDAVAATYLAAGTDIPETLREIFASSGFRTAHGAKLRRPFGFLAAAFRVLAPEVTDDPPPLVPAAQSVGGVALRRAGRARDGLPMAVPVPELPPAPDTPRIGVPNLDQTARALDRLLGSVGQAPFQWPSPDGYPDVAVAWQHSGGLLARWNAVLDVVLDRVDGVRVSPDGWFDGSRPATAGALVNALFERILLRAPTHDERDAVLTFLQAAADAPVADGDFDRDARHVAALVASSPAFQRR